MSNPYINLKSYTEANADKFKGRDNEIKDILAILKHSDIVILYSESAEGKSSLLDAGLTPRLRQMGYIPIKIVFTDDEFKNPNPNFNSIVFNRIQDVIRRANENIIKDAAKRADENLFDANGEQAALKPISFPSFSKHINESELFEWISTSDVEMPDDSDPAQSLIDNAWWLLRNFAVERYAARFHFALVFDQFEEVFSRSDVNWVDALFSWLENLYSDKCPDNVSEALLNFYSEEESVPQFNLNRSFKEIFSMRNEYIGDLDYWGVQKHFMPELKNSRYCLKPLTINEAREVIELGFKDKPELKTKILCALAGCNEEELQSLNPDLPSVQPMILSVVCSALSQSESESIHNYITALKGNHIETIQNIVYDAYRKQLNEINIPNSVRTRIEDTLIDINGKRVRIKTSTPALKGIKFDIKYKEALKKQGIVKTSKINGEDYVELVHDQLANAIYRRSKIKSQGQRAILSIFLVACLCIAFFALWLNSNMEVSKKDIVTTRNIDKYSLALLDENESDNLSKSGGNLKNDPFVQTYTIDSYEYNHSIDITDNKNLKSLIIAPHNDSTVKHISLDENILLKKITLLDSVENLILQIDDNNGFCQVDIGKGTKNIQIAPRTKYLEINSADSSYVWIDNRLWNLKEKMISFIPNDLISNYYFPFPFPLDSTLYNNSKYYNIDLTSTGTLDLRAFSFTEIPTKAFRNGSFQSVILPPNLQKINSQAFRDCPNLKTILIPASVTSIARDAFDDSCELRFERDFIKDEIVMDYIGTTLSSVKIPQREGTLDLSSYKDMTGIEYFALSNSRFSSVILPSNLKKINDYAFRDCPNLKHIVIPASVTYIAKDAFDDSCEVMFKSVFNYNELDISPDGTTLKSVKIPQRKGTLDLSSFTDITEIKANALSRTRFDSIILPPNLKKIGSMAFSRCPNLNSIIIPPSVISTEYAFDSGCEVRFERGFNQDELDLSPDGTTLKSVKIPQRRGTLDLSSFTDITEIEAYALSRTRFDSIILPPNLKKIGIWAFHECSNLKRIVLTASIDTVYYSSFDHNCNVLFEENNSKFTVKAGVETFDSYFPEKQNCFDFRTDKRKELNLTVILDSTLNKKVFLSPNIEKFYCNYDENLIYIGAKSLRDLVRQKKYIREDDKYIKSERLSDYSNEKLSVKSSNDLINFKGTYYNPACLTICNDITHSKDMYFSGRGHLMPTMMTDSILKFKDKSRLSDIQSIHLGLPRPLIWTMKNDTARLSIFTIDIPDSLKSGITLYVPYGSRKFYEGNPNFKAFKDIREDTLLRRYEDIIFNRLYPMYRWFTVPINLIETTCAVFIVCMIFFFSYKKHYLNEHSYVSRIKVNVLTIINGTTMGIISILGFAAVYWWVWDYTGHNHLYSKIAGGIGAICALSLCYFNVLPTFLNLSKKWLMQGYNTIQKIFR